MYGRKVPDEATELFPKRRVGEVRMLEVTSRGRRKLEISNVAAVKSNGESRESLGAFAEQRAGGNSCEIPPDRGLGAGEDNGPELVVRLATCPGIFDVI